ncbi:MAG: IS66 family transposase [bacterium]
MSTASKNGRLTLTRPICPQCVKLQEEVKRLRAENHRLKEQNRYQQRKIAEGYFGASTPSSKKPFKANTQAAHNHGGARAGHRGHGRRLISEQQADVVQEINLADHVCPDCKVALNYVDSRSRQVVDMASIKVKSIVNQLQRWRCPNCRRPFRAKAPEVLPKCEFGNTLLANVATEHYFHGIPMNRVATRLDLNAGSLLEAMHRLARHLHNIPDQLIAEYRQAPVKHADETGWRNDGGNAFAWFYGTPDTSIFRLRPSRSARVVREVLGEEPLPGVLVVDRYNAYNQAPCLLQYCYSHLLREVQALGKEFPTHQEVQNFSTTAAPLLADAIKLRSLSITDKAFYDRADLLRLDIEQVMHSPAQQAGIQKIQNIFRENASRLYHWAKDRAVPADNNLSERDLRSLVIARKISFGSQSPAGAKTREILMTTLVTLSKRFGQAEVIPRLKACLDQLANDPKQDCYQLLFATNTS